MTRKRSNFFPLAAVIIFPFLLVTVHAQPALKEAIQAAKKSVVQIICADIDSKGTGFVAQKDGYIFTNHHVVCKYTFEGDKLTHADYSKNITVRFEDGAELPATLAFKKGLVDDKRPLLYDYAILKLDGSKFTPVAFADYDSTPEGSDVYFCGFPLSAEHLTTHKGVVSAKYAQPGAFKGAQQNVFQIDGSVNKGNSGGPLFDLATCKVIAIVSTREGTISKDLENIRNHIITEKAKSNQGVSIQGVDPLRVLVELTNTLDRYISVGMGRAISTEYALKHLNELLAK